MRICFIFIAFVSLLCSCKKSESIQDNTALVKVNGRTLERSTVLNQLPRDISSADSLLYSESIQKKWIIDQLIYDLAQKNLDNDEKSDVDRLVDEYRNSLLRYRFQEKLVNEKLINEFQDKDKEDYYQQNKDKFLLSTPLVKGLFLKIPIDAPGIDDIKKWYKNPNEASIEKIEKYSVQNAIIYDYFNDRWVSFDEILRNIPVKIVDLNDFLKNRKYIEVADSSYWYLVNITSSIPKGEIAPYDYSTPQIVEMMTNLKKMDFLKKFEEDLYNDAVKNGDVKFQAEP